MKYQKLRAPTTQISHPLSSPPGSHHDMLNKSSLIAFTLLFCLLIAACAAKKEFKETFDTEKPWVEQLAQLPPYPDLNNLIPLIVQTSTDYQHTVDPESISIGDDGVVRLTLVSRSSAGAMNISYEGIRCETNERKLYAIGRNDKTWSKPRVSEWQSLDFVKQFYAHRELSKNLLCPDKYPVRSKEEAIKILKTGKNPSVFRFVK